MNPDRYTAVTDPRVVEAINAALGAAAQQTGPAWARITQDVGDLRRRLWIADRRHETRLSENEADDVIRDALAALRGYENDDSDWPALRDARIAGIRELLVSIARERSVIAEPVSAAKDEQRAA
jgi:hypothetical protein